MPTHVKITQIKEGEDNPANLNKMENKLTSEESIISSDIAYKLAQEELGYANPSFSLGAQAMFNLLWPYIGEAWRAGKLYGIKEMKEYHGGPENNQPCEPDYLKKLLAALKSLADGQ